MMAVTGAAGFLGREIVRSLVRRGLGPVRGLVRPGPPRARLEAAGLLAPGVEAIPCRLEDAGAVERALLGADVDLPLGRRFSPQHGPPGENALEAHEHRFELTSVGRVVRLGTPWDRAIVVPIEAAWASCGSPATVSPMA